ncbi:MAG: hypothetical protein D6738_06075, partial [Acidobacteria bacterium]
MAALLLLAVAVPVLAAGGDGGDPNFAMTDTTTFDRNDVVSQAPGVPEGSIFAGFENNENVSLYNGNLLISHATGPSYPLDGGGSFGLVRSYNSKNVRRYHVRYPNDAQNRKVYKDLVSGGSWIGFGWTMHLGRLFQDRNYRETFSGDPDWDYAPGAKYFVDAAGTEHKVFGAPGREEAHPFLRLAWFDGASPYYEVTTEDGTRYRLEKIVNDVEVSRQWLRNRDRAGWYTTRIEDVHGNAVTVEYWSGHCTEAGLADDACPYPEAIRHVASVQHPEMEITT